MFYREIEQILALALIRIIRVHAIFAATMIILSNIVQINEQDCYFCGDSKHSTMNYPNNW